MLSRPRGVALAALALLALVTPAPASGQPSLGGWAAVLGDLFPRIPVAGGDHEAVAELRARLLLESKLDAGRHLRLEASGFAEGLLASRPCPPTPGDDCRSGRAAVVRPRELHAELAYERAELRVGYSRVAWGRLDELQPTDVVNPLDLSRFFLEGRAEARRAVPMARMRIFLPADIALDAIAVPQFRPTVFDELEPATSPFNPVPPPIACAAGACSEVPVVSGRPPVTAANVQGGARLTVTFGRVDWALSGWRGFEPLPFLRLAPGDGAVPPGAALETVHPRFTMIGGDFETVRGAWGVRGEFAAFVRDSVQVAAPLSVARARSVEGGVGVDRKAGAYRVSGNILVRRRALEESPGAGAVTWLDRTDVNVIAAVDRAFARETRRVRLFAVLDPTEGTAFTRVIGTWRLRDDLVLDVSGGLFTGSGSDTLGVYADRDFASVALKRYF